MRGLIMSEQQPNLTVSELTKVMQAGLNGRSLLITLLLWFFLGYLGAHRFYLGKYKSAVAMAILTIVGWLTAFIVIGIFILIGVGIWWVVDLVNILMAASREADQRAKAGAS
tara:strand:- start:1323 stop:1658 length:336 start_codon:yes stop_codon:yes gene_type:complete